jgi:hypothetical protein
MVEKSLHFSSYLVPFHEHGKRMIGAKNQFPVRFYCQKPSIERASSKQTKI